MRLRSSKLIAKSAPFVSNVMWLKMDNHKEWGFNQRFSVRASTMLYMYVAFLAAFFRVVPISMVSNQDLAKILGGLGEVAPILLVIASIFGLAFFIYSVIKKNPQIQYFVEAVLGFSIFIATPIY